MLELEKLKYNDVAYYMKERAYLPGHGRIRIRVLLKNLNKYLAENQYQFLLTLLLQIQYFISEIDFTVVEEVLQNVYNLII